MDPYLNETFKCSELKINDEIALRGEIPWLIDEFLDKINSVY